jgi:hypothetical protein
MGQAQDALPPVNGQEITLTIAQDGHFVDGDQVAVDVVVGLLELPEIERRVRVRALTAEDSAYRRTYPEQYLRLRDALKLYEQAVNFLMRGGARYCEDWQASDLAEAVVELRGLALPGIGERESWYAWPPADPSRALRVRFTEANARFVRSGYYRHVPEEGGLRGVQGLPDDEPIWLASIFPTIVWQRIIPAAVWRSVQDRPDDPAAVDVTGWVLSDRPPSQLARQVPSPQET